jgi:NADH-quinone oxidoreductase subunit G
MAKQVTISIDGQQVTVPEGTLVVNAAKKIGIDIPVFCYHPKMEPVGMCRMCLVEVGRPVVDRAAGQIVMEDGKLKIQFGAKLETACTTPVSEGMVVLTQSEKARANQKDIVEFLLTSHPLDCPVCDKGGECPLQNLTLAHGPSRSRFLYAEKMHLEKHVPLGELIWLDRERCIQCARCIRFQDEIAGEPVIDFYHRGRSTDIVTYSEPGFDSIFSGNTTDICPVGALTTADFRFGARPWEMKAAASICAQCAVGCNITFNTRRDVKSDGKVVVKRVMPRQNEYVNEIWICDKGRFAYHFTDSPDRLARPLIRKGGRMENISWNEAIDSTVKKFKAAREDFVVLASGRLSNEDLFNLKQLADGLGGEAILYTQMGGGDLTTFVGLGQGTNFADIGKGTAILVVASDLYNEAPIWYLRIKQAVRRGAALVVANARGTKLENYAAHVIRYAYGDEAATIEGLLRSKSARAAVDAFTSAENLVILYGSDGLGLDGSTALATACARLLVDTHHVGKANNGLMGVWPRANDQGAWELGFRPVADLRKALKGKTVYIIAADPAGDAPSLVTALKGAKSVVVQELFLTATARLADIVLPARAYTERSGTYTSGERRLQRFCPAVPPHGQARPDFVITAQIAKDIGLELEGRSVSLVMDGIAATIPAFAGISYRKLSAVAEQWPVIGHGDLYYGGTTYENVQGLGVQLVPAVQRGEVARIPEARLVSALRPQEGQWLLLPVTRLYDNGIMVSTSGLLRGRIGAAYLALHPQAARRIGVEAGGLAEVKLDGVVAKVKVVLDETVSASVALLPRSMGIPMDSPAIAVIRAVKE